MRYKISYTPQKAKVYWKNIQKLIIKLNINIDIVIIKVLVQQVKFGKYFSFVTGWRVYLYILKSLEKLFHKMFETARLNFWGITNPYGETNNVVIVSNIATKAK